MSFNTFLGYAILPSFKGKTLIFEVSARKFPIFGLKPRFLALKPFNLYTKKWLVLAVF
jgi:hypothetical protein